MSVIEVLPALLAVSAVGLLAFIYLKTKGSNGKEVLFFRPRDKRGERFVVTRETDRSLMCERSDPIHRFIKIAPSYTFKEGAKSVTRFLGVEGTAYTAKIGDGKTVQLSTEQFLKSLWGNKIYNALPQRMKDAIEKDKIGITVEPTKISPEEHGLETITSDEVNDEGDATILNRLAKFGMGENMKQKLLNNLIWLGLGIGLAAILSKFGWF